MKKDAVIPSLQPPSPLVSLVIGGDYATLTGGDGAALGFCAGLLLATATGAGWAAYTDSLPPFQAVAVGLGGALASILAVGMVRAWWLR